MPAQWHSLGAFLRACGEINPFVRRSHRSRSSTVQVRAIEQLEERRLLTAVSWISDANGFWDDPANWSTGQVPSFGDDVTIDRGAFNPIITVRDDRNINTLVDREAIVITSGTLRVGTSTQIDGTSVTLEEGAGLTLVGTATITDTGAFNWAGGTFFSSATTNAGTINITSATDVRFIGTLTNNASVIHSGAGSVLFDSSTRFFNSSTGLYEFSGSGDIGLSNMGAGFAPFFQNDGTLTKSAGAESEIINLQLNSSSTSVFVATGGRLDLASSGTLSGATFSASTGGVVEISGGYSIEGAFTGSGDSHMELTGSLATTGAATTFNFPTGFFQWTGGALGGGGSGLTNNGAITVAPTTSVRVFGLLTNNGTIIQSGDGKLQLDGSTQLLNASTGIYDIQGNGDIDRSHFGAGFAPFFQNNGTLRKSSGTGISTIEEIDLNGGANAVVDVQAGRIKAVSNGTWAGGSFTGDAGGVFEINGTIGVQGTVTGVGGGQLELTGNLNAAAGTTLNFADGTFQWLSGSISGAGSGVTNLGTITVAGASDKTAFGRLISSGTINHTGTGRLLINTSSVITITETGLYDFQGDGGWGRSTIGGGFFPNFEIRGTLRKSAGAGTSLLDGETSHFSVDLIEGQIDVQTGRLLLDDQGLWNGADIHVTSGAIFEMSGDAGLAMTGQITGSGAGRVELNTSIASYDFGISGSQATLDFPEGQLYWMSGLIGSVGGGGTSGSSNTMVNAGYITIDGADAKGVFGNSLSNAGTIVNIGSGDFNTNGYNLTNQFGGVFEIRGNSQFNGTDQFGNPGRFINAGEFRKTTDAGTVTYSGRFDNTVTGTIDVATGRMKLSRGGDMSGGVFDVGPAAVLEFAGIDQFNMSGNFTGTGVGTVEFNAPLNGGDQANPAVLDFPEDMFQFQGGLNFGFGGNIVNEGWFYFASPFSQSARAGITNNGTFVHSGAGDFVLNANSRFFNQGVYDLQTDADLLVPGDQSGGAMVFTNVGTFIKSGGTGLSSFRHDGSNKEFRLDNLGTIDVRTGTLSINDTVVQRVGTTLAAGTWRVGAGATLTMPGGSNFTVNQANVELNGVGAAFPNLTPLASNTGRLTLNSGSNFITAGNLTNTGDITLGVGSVLTVSGNYTQTGGTSSLREIIGGRPNTGLFGKLVATGQASLAGRLIFTLASGFGPSLGDQYQVLQYGSKVGDFGLIAGLPPFFTADVQATQTLLTAIGEGTNISTQSVTPPANGTVGQNATISYTVQNSSDDAIPGDWTDSVYLSRDSIFSADDVLFARVPHLGGLAANGSYIGTANGLVPNVIDGDYHVIVIADTSLDVPDTNRTDNTLASSGVVNVTVPALAFNTPFNSTIINGQEKLFRLDVPSGSDVLLLADLVVSIQAEVLIGFGRIPSPGNSDYAALDLNDLNREILISNPQTGAYYVLIRGREGATTAQSFSLSARQAGFEVRSVGPNHGSNLGQTTVSIVGSGFTPESVVKLIAPNGFERTASSVAYQDSNSLFATFDLTGLAVGSGYDIRVTNGAVNATGADLFTINQGAVGQVEFRIIAPKNIRPNREGELLLEYFNNGETDIPAPVLSLSGGNAVFRLPDQPNYIGDRIEVFAYNPTGLAGVLPPGARGVIPIRFLPQTFGGHVVSNFTVTAVNSGLTVNWSAAKDALRPPTIPADAWNVVFANFVAAVGNNSDQYQQLIRENANYLSRMGIYTANIIRLYGFELKQADDFGAITKRWTLGSFGRGQPDTVNSTVQVDADGNVLVFSGGVIRAFTRNANGSYSGVSGDEGVLTKTASGGYRLREPLGVVTAFTSDGKLEYIEDTNHVRRTAVYTNGRVSSFVDTNGDVVSFVYNGQGRISQMTDPVGRVTTFNYDSSGEHLLTITNARGTTTMTYITGQGLAKEHALSSITYPDGTQFSFEYDAQGRVSRRTRNGGAEALTYAYDSAGKVTITDVLGNVATLYRDDSSAIGLFTDPLRNSVTIGLDGGHQVTGLEGAAGAHLSVDRDDDANPTTLRDSQGNVIIFEFDPVTQRLSRVVDPRGNQTLLDHDSKGNLLSLVNAAGQEIQFSYDAHGNRTVTEYASGRSQSATFDAHDLVLNRIFSDGSRIDYGYDAHRNLVSVTDASGTTLLTYDAADRLKRVTYPNGRWVQYHYDSAGRRSQVVTQDGFTTNYEYDALGRLARVSNGANQTQATYGYDTIGRLTLKTLGNGTTTVYTYNAGSQLLSVVNRAPDTSIQSKFEYTYDSVGRRTSMTTLEGTTTYGYDSIGQLISVALPGGRTIHYQYDAVGNRTQVDDDGSLTSYSANNLNQYTTAGNAALTYDADGNLLTRTDGTGTTTYAYDVRNRLIGSVGPTDTWTYEYNSLGQRAAVVHNGVRTEYLVDPTGLGNVVGEYNQVGAAVAYYARGTGVVSRQEAGGDADYYQFDGLGNTAALTGAAGSIEASYSYLPFGEKLTSTGSDSNPFTYVGEAGVMDVQDGLYDMRNRIYDPRLGRFTQVDPISLVGGDINLYRYVANSPVLLTDPSGLALTPPPPGAVGAAEWLLQRGLNIAIDGALDSVSANLFLETLAEAEAGVVEATFVGGTQLEVGLGGTVFVKTVETAGTGATTASSTTTLAAAPFAGLIAFTAASGVASIGYIKTVTDSDYNAAAFTDNPVRMDYEYLQRLKNRNESDPLKKAVALDLARINGHPGQPTPEDEIRASRIVDDYRNKKDGSTEQVASGDPNEIIGPADYVRTDQTLPYTILFENMPTASAPALEVIITQTLDSDLDLSTFELGDIAFGAIIVDVPAGLSSFKTRVHMDAADNIGGAPLDVDIEAMLDFTTRVVTWQFSTIDPVTGDVPSNPLAGFLPPNVNSPEGDGSVSYTVRPNAGLQTGVVIDSEARIVFDTNEPIDTPHITNTIDSGVPTSSVNALTATQDFPTFQVSWSGTDDANGPTGSGIAFYDVYVSDNGGDFVLFLEGTIQTSAVFTGQVNHTYSFYSIATDNVGFQQDPVNAGQTSTQVLDVLFDFGDAPDPFFSTPGKYPTLLANDGPRHKLGSGLFLGAGVDREFDGQPTATADGDDVAGVPDDENGVVFASLIRGTTGSATVTSSQAGKLDAWIDFNRDGDWDDAGEQVATSLSVNAGSNNVSLVVPAGALTGSTFARFRLSSAGGLGDTGAADDGEVEDYQVTVISPLISNSGGAVTWTKKDPPVSILPLVSVPFSNLANGTLTISMNSTGSKKKSVDLLAIPAFAGTSSSLVPVYSGGNRLTLTLQLNGTVTANEIQTFLRNIKFSTKGKGVNLSPRTMTVTLENSSGASSTVTQTINVVKKAPRAPR